MVFKLNYFPSVIKAVCKEQVCQRYERLLGVLNENVTQVIQVGGIQPRLVSHSTTYRTYWFNQKDLH